MLTLFRKYQKIIFIFTTAIIIVSFTFFGAMNSMGGNSEVKEETLVKAIDGSSISLQKVERMLSFLSSSHLDLKDDQAMSVNLLNNGVLEKQFLSSGLGRLLAEKISTEIEKDVEKTISKAHSFQSYRHAKAPFITSEAIWAQFAPESAKLVSELTLNASSLSFLKKFDLLSQGFLQHQTVPSSFIRKVIAYQSQQMAQGEEDPSLPYADVSLLGLHSAKDWMGETYIRAAAQVIINGAAYARKQGYTVSSQEARDAMIANAKEAVQLLAKDVGPETNFYQIFLTQVRNLGMNELESIDLWKDISLFQKLFQAASNSILLSPEIFPAAKEQCLIEKYSIPSHLKFRDFTSFMKLQLYITAISSKKRSKDSLLSLPVEFLPLSEIEKKAPDLVQRDYVLEYSELDLKKAASQIGLKETWAWQMQDKGWDLLKEKYSYLSKEAKAKEERFAELESVNPKQRLEMDKFSREQILSKDEERIKKELEFISPESRSISISSTGFELPFKGISNMQSLVALLEIAPLKGEGNISSIEAAAQEKMNFYTGDNQHYYKINLVERFSFKKIQTFAEADASGALRRMLDKKLESAYLEVRKKDSIPYMKKEGSWKPLAEVKEKVGLAIYSPVLKAIVEEYQSLYGKDLTKEQTDSTEFYVQNWMLFHVNESLVKAKEGVIETQENPLLAQWKLVQKKESILKKDYPALSSFIFEEGSWSTILSLASEKLCFFKVLQNLEAAPFSEDEIEKIAAPLKREVEKTLFDQLFSEIQAKKALSFKVSL